MANDTRNGFYYICLPEVTLNMVKEIAEKNGCSVADAISIAIGKEYQALNSKPT